MTTLRLLAAGLGLVGSETSDDAEAWMTSGKTRRVDLIEPNADRHDLGRAVGVVADEGEVQLQGPALSIGGMRTVAASVSTAATVTQTTASMGAHRFWK